MITRHTKQPVQLSEQELSDITNTLRFVLQHTLTDDERERLTMLERRIDIETRAAYYMRAQDNMIHGRPQDLNEPVALPLHNARVQAFNREGE